MKLSMTKKDSMLRVIMGDLFPDEKEKELKDPIGIMLRDSVDKLFVKGWEKYAEHISTGKTFYIRTPKNGEIRVFSPRPFPEKRAGDRYNNSYITFSYGELTETEKYTVSVLCDWLDDREEKKKLFGSILKSINTSKQLTDTLPEMIKYLPIEDQPTSIISVEAIEKAKLAMSTFNLDK